MTQKEELQLHGDTKENKTKKKKKMMYRQHIFKTVQMECLNINKLRKKMS